MKEFRKFADDAPQVGDVVQLLDDSGVPDINKVPISEVIRIVDKTSLSGDTGVTPAVSQVWEVRDEEGMSWMVARNPEGDEGGKRGYLQVRIASSEFRKISDDSDKQLEMGIKVELEHKDTIKKFRKNSEMTDREVAEMIAKDHLAEKKDYYTALKAMESKASLLKESSFASWWMDNRNSESLYETYQNCMKDLQESTGEKPIPFIDWARKHYTKTTSASLLKECLMKNWLENN